MKKNPNNCELIKKKEIYSIRIKESESVKLNLETYSRTHKHTNAHKLCILTKEKLTTFWHFTEKCELAVCEQVFAIHSSVKFNKTQNKTVILRVNFPFGVG